MTWRVWCTIVLLTHEKHCLELWNIAVLWRLFVIALFSVLSRLRRFHVLDERLNVRLSSWRHSFHCVPYSSPVLSLSSVFIGGRSDRDYV